jgi:hypothetical protein
VGKELAQLEEDDVDLRVLGLVGLSGPLVDTSTHPGAHMVPPSGPRGPLTPLILED